MIHTRQCRHRNQSPAGLTIQRVFCVSRQGRRLMAETKSEKCARPGCNCPVPKGSKYCGAYCQASAGRPSAACNCGHPECAGGNSRLKTRVITHLICLLRAGYAWGGVTDQGDDVYLGPILRPTLSAVANPS